MKRVTIAHKTVGEGSPVFIIAEAGCNHNGDIALAMELVDAAVEAGADAVKFQTFITEDLVTSSIGMADYQKRNTGNGKETQHAMLKRLELSFDAFRSLKDYCDQRGALFLSTPYDARSVAFLDGLGVPAFKIASGDLTNLPLLHAVASRGKPLILSTGMSTEEEVGEALAAIQGIPQAPPVILLHCTSAYPASPGETNLRAMNTLQHRFQVPVGFSDHTVGDSIALAAVALGATVLEKHVTLDKNREGPDHFFSLEREELKRLVGSIRSVEQALGDGIKVPVQSEEPVKAIARKSIVAATPISKGEPFSEENLTVKRAGRGISPARWHDLLGRRAERDFNKDELIECNDTPLIEHPPHGPAVNQESAWNDSFGRGENFVFYPHEEVIRFFSKYIRKRVGLDTFKDIVPFTIPPRVLDLGCGIGRHVMYANSMGADAYGIDLSHRAVRTARAWAQREGVAHYPEKITQGDCTRLPYQQGFFDYALSHGVLDSMSFDAAREAAKEVARVLKRHGLFYCDLVSGDDSSHCREYNKEEVVEAEHERGTIQSFFNFAKIRSLFDPLFDTVECTLIKKESVLSPQSTARYHLVLRKP